MKDAMKVKIKILENGKDLPIPKKATEYAACVDLYSTLDTTLDAGMTKLIPCGFCIEIPIGYEAQVRPRSGLALKNNIMVLNTPGTIDADYRGEVGVILHNATQTPCSTFVIKKGDRIAQMGIRETVDFEFEVAEELSDTNRGSGGFGHTGVTSK